MTYTIAGYFENQDSAGALVNILALPDDHINAIGDDIRVPKLWTKLGFVFMSGIDITQGQISSPSLERTNLLDVIPLNDGVVEPTSPQTILDLTPRMIELEADENLRARAAEDNVAADDEYCIIGLFDEITPLPPGKIITVRCDDTQATVANAWTSGTLTFSQQLPAGDYAVVGMRVEGATMIAGRLIFTGLPQRPGCLGTDTHGDLEYPKFRNGGYGVLGTFGHINPPRPEYLTSGVDAAQTIWLDLIGPL